MCIIVILAIKAQFSTTTSSEVSSNKCDTGVQRKINMAAETGNANIFGIVTNRIEIPTANLKFSTIRRDRSLRDRIVSGQSAYDNDGQSKMAI